MFSPPLKKSIVFLKYALKMDLVKGAWFDLYENKSKELQFSLFKRTVIDKNGIAVSLTSKEFDLLYFLYLHKGQVFTKEQLYENVWGFEDMPKDTSNLPSFIRKLRKKIEPDPDNPIYIITVWGVGYKFSEEKP